MNKIEIAKNIVKKKIEKADLSMFSEAERGQIYIEAAKILLRLNRTNEAFIALEKSGNLPVDELMKIIDKAIELGEYEKSYNLLTKLGKAEMAEFIKRNFM